jgi:LacI family transcriptional regulator, galactose operon repressor
VSLDEAGAFTEPGRASGHLTSRDIARAAGVSQATVSNVLNRPELVAPETVLRVREVMEKLGFVVNDSARSLRAGRSRTLGVVTLDLSNPFWGEVTRGIEAVASEHGLPVLFGASEEDPAKELQFLRLFEEHRVGSILLSSVDVNSRKLREMHRRGTKVVILDQSDPKDHYSSVTFNHVAGARLVAEHLIRYGHRRIAFLNGPHSVPWCRARAQGLREGLAACGVDPEEAVLEFTIKSMTAQSAEPAVGTVLASGFEPTAVFCVNDMVALGVLKVLSQRGIHVPEDLSIVGFDDSYFSSLLSPALTTVRQQPYELGKKATEMVMALAPGAAPVTYVFEPEIMLRDSVRDIT